LTAFYSTTGSTFGKALSITFKYHGFSKVIEVIVLSHFLQIKPASQFCLKNAPERFSLAPRLKSTASQVFVFTVIFVRKLLHNCRTFALADLLFKFLMLTNMRRHDRCYELKHLSLKREVACG